MNPIGAISSAYNPLPISPASVSAPKLPGAGDGLVGAPAQGGGFGSMLDGLVSSVSGKDAQAQALTNNVILGNSDSLHSSVIAMQESSVALSLMVQVRNKLVESYQELMRMQV
jgi:flagellar hook-basal body complex protein FliE